MGSGDKLQINFGWSKVLNYVHGCKLASYLSINGMARLSSLVASDYAIYTLRMYYVLAFYLLLYMRMIIILLTYVGE